MERVDHHPRARKHLGVPETENPEALRVKPGISCAVGRVFGVLTAIGLDDQARRETGEVGDVAPDRDLPPELAVRQPTVSQKPPQNPLGVGGLMPHGAGMALELIAQRCGCC
jgi:hypothetical protein